MAAPGGAAETPADGEGLVLGRLEEEALKRRERLKALRQRTLQNKDGGERENKIPRQEEDEEPVKHKEIKLRNYEPEDEELKKRKLPPGKPASVEDTVKEQLEAAKPEPIIDEVVGSGKPGSQETGLGFEAGCVQEAGEAGEEDPEGHRGADPREAEGAGGGVGVCRGISKAGGIRLRLRDPSDPAPAPAPFPRGDPRDTLGPFPGVPKSCRAWRGEADPRSPAGR
ncbi:coiled-coil domain-containing protein 12 isoform X1 [Manacus candei]|uniref:coiled-coil domain-containing protein 12 isoform X1 n=1 Tax=Manacus candei TaxID=415023 RepID=UPI002226863F|nr:coiled-coil domain-containing protein 12 isoform X1 [Manacus candei]